MAKKSSVKTYKGRLGFIYLLLAAAAVVLVVRAAELQLFQRDFLQKQGDARYVRQVEVPVYRGVIKDRNGEILAVSIPVDSVWINPKEFFAADADDLLLLANALNIDLDRLQQKIAQRAEKEFVYLKRRVAPETAEEVANLAIEGVFLQREYKRYYPLGEVASHIVGFTNIDDSGQEGVELAFENILRGEPGKKRVIKDRYGKIIKNIELVKTAKPGNDIVLSIDKRLQYLAYRELKQTVAHHQATSGSIVILDIASGEILAMANQPSYNPNQRSSLNSSNQRNRALTDVFEPGSVIKPFVIAAALETNNYLPETVIDTNPGWMKVDDLTIRDFRNYGQINLAQVLSKSSNIGVSKIAMNIGSKNVWQTYKKFGFGEVTGTGFPGESPGILQHYDRWQRSKQLTVSYGYGLSVTALQLAQAYAVMANKGNLIAPSFLKKETVSNQRKIINQDIANGLTTMLEMVIADDGTGKRAQLEYYRASGKTGTARKVGKYGYQDRYVATFAGFAPATAPKVAVVVTINDPAGEQYYGGQVAAPVFSNVMSNTLRILDVTPDKSLQQRVVSKEKVGQFNG